MSLPSTIDIPTRPRSFNSSRPCNNRQPCKIQATTLTRSKHNMRHHRHNMLLQLNPDPIEMDFRADSEHKASSLQRACTPRSPMASVFQHSRRLHLHNLLRRRLASPPAPASNKEASQHLIKHINPTNLNSNSSNINSLGCRLEATKQILGTFTDKGQIV